MARVPLTRVWRTLLWALFTTALAPATPQAHLALIRQGLDSAGSLEPDDFHGWAVATGDFNADGYDDLAAGAPFDDVTVGMINVADAGAVVISYGSKYGLTHIGAQLRTAQSIGGTSTAGALFGWALAAGDFDGDGDDDLAVGAPFETVAGDAEAGRVYILHGGAAGLGATLSRTIVQSEIGDPIDPQDHFGYAFAVGNFDGDANNREDLAVGAPGEDASAGAVFHLPGSVTGLTNAGSGWFRQSTLGFTDQVGARFGHALAAGTIVGDGSVDLIVGAPFYDNGQVADVGVVYAIFGSAAGLTPVGATRHDATFQGGAEDGAYFGYSLAPVRLSVTGNPRLLLGEPGRNIGGADGAGRVIVVQGGAGGLLFGATSVKVITQEMAGTVSATDDRFGEAVAAGNWDVDGREDIAVGTPGKAASAAPTASEVGLVQVFLSTLGAPASGASFRFERDTLNFEFSAYDRLGHALAFGAFDGTNRANLAIGSPGHDDDEDGFDENLFSQYFETDREPNVGCVFILAPWRQALDLPSRSSAVLDCEDELVFSQRPFDHTGPASTTKVMTALVAYERTQLPPSDPDYMPLDALFNVDLWHTSGMGTSVFPLEEFEQITLRNLLRGLMTVSANDAAYAIADLLSGGTPNSILVPEFALTMRDRAGAIGMTRTYFGNPPGRDPWKTLDTLHHSTAYDMVLLGREAMENDELRILVGTPFFDIVRDVVRDGERANIPWTLANSFITDLRTWHDNASGIKPGMTSGAGRTRLFAADSSGRVIAGMFGCPLSDTRNLGKRGAALLRLAFSQCESQLFLPVPPDPPEQPFMIMTGVSTAPASRRGGSGDGGDDATDSLTLEVELEQGVGPASLRLWLNRRSRAELAPGEIAQVGFSTFQSHGGCVVRNGGPAPATVQVVASHPPTAASYVLAPGQEVVLASYTGATLVPFSLAVQNQAADSASIEIEERGHRLDLTVPLGAGFAGVLTHGPPVRLGSLQIETKGLDDASGNAVRVVVRPPQAEVVGVPRPGDARAAPAPLRVESAWPNPFSERVQLFFDLARRGRVGVSLYDVAGRRVREFSAQTLDPGRWNFEWDATGAGGERLGSGVYFARFALDGLEVADLKLVVVR